MALSKEALEAFAEVMRESATYEKFDKNGPDIGGFERVMYHAVPIVIDRHEEAPVSNLPLLVDEFDRIAQAKSIYPYLESHLVWCSECGISSALSAMECDGTWLCENRFDCARRLLMNMKPGDKPDIYYIDLPLSPKEVLEWWATHSLEYLAGRADKKAFQEKIAKAATEKVTEQLKREMQEKAFLESWQASARHKKSFHYTFNSEGWLANVIEAPLATEKLTVQKLQELYPKLTMGPASPASYGDWPEEVTDPAGAVVEALQPTETVVPKKVTDNWVDSLYKGNPLFYHLREKGKKKK